MWSVKKQMQKDFHEWHVHVQNQALAEVGCECQPGESVEAWWTEETDVVQVICPKCKAEAFLIMQDVVDSFMGREKPRTLN